MVLSATTLVPTCPGSALPSSSPPPQTDQLCFMKAHTYTPARFLGSLPMHQRHSAFIPVACRCMKPKDGRTTRGPHPCASPPSPPCLLGSGQDLWKSGPPKCLERWCSDVFAQTPVHTQSHVSHSFFFVLENTVIFIKTCYSC